MNIPTIAIERVRGREILDSRGRPTVEAEVLLADGSVGNGVGAFGRIDRRPRSNGVA